MRLLITGGAGFIGSHLVDYLLKYYPNYHIITLDSLTYAGSLTNLSDALVHPQHRFIQGDILDKKLLAEIFEQYQINGVIHLAAESHVDNSIKAPDAFIQTNIIGTFNLLEVANKAWEKKSSSALPYLYRFHHVSTDEVYGSLGQQGTFSENSAYRPNSPYSASKASSDMLVRSYHKTYGLNTVITNCSNNFGPRQHDEKLIPTIIQKALAAQPIPIYGNGHNIRDWLYVTDHCDGLAVAFHKGTQGEVYNIGAEQEYSNLTLCHEVCHLLDQLKPRDQNGSYKELIHFVTDRAGHDFRYAVNHHKISQLGWKPKFAFKQALEKTIAAYQQRYAK